MCLQVPVRAELGRGHLSGQTCHLLLSQALQALLEEPSSCGISHMRGPLSSLKHIAYLPNSECPRCPSLRPPCPTVAARLGLCCRPWFQSLLPSKDPHELRFG